ncbi:hypothetical protein [Bremerella cremea]|uniref:hypothetical protein n=1 Tax=Bremerella cremea TaxID=1031537 RepID=UPI0011C01B69|nr:hypothetical protein [Bremerella cremea]
MLRLLTRSDQTRSVVARRRNLFSLSTHTLQQEETLGKRVSHFNIARSKASEFAGLRLLVRDFHSNFPD